MLGVQRGDNGGFVCDTISAGMLTRNQIRETITVRLYLVI